MYRKDYDYKDSRHLNTRSSIQFKRTNYTDTFNEGKYQYSETNSFSVKPQSSSVVKYENKETMKSKGINNTKSSHSKSFMKNISESSTIYSKGNSISRANSNLVRIL